ncbi:PREDICTED: general transcription factor 3C polypeptide 5-like [Priapulus caudatus]|uniref:General transcription factor 3C polypeptide 5-like n=1 Tax=Priapulus caudatus TaxID=37621 RepID=A0ABM1E1M0_PRICU|nr:PREDICTED: general transcription factor 3C polypeptide 5-like [Priapulus caudatus]
MNSSGTDGSDVGESVVLPDAINVPFNQTRKFVLVEYPAVVMNVDKMLTSLGGENAVSRANADPSRRLELRFRPQDIFCKPACGDRFNTTNLLMKVVRRRKKKSSGLGAERREPEVTLHAEILGVVDTTYRFQSMVDFQYLPMQRNADGTKFDSVYKDIVPQKIEMPGWLSQSAPLFVPPLIFSRFDQPVDYHFRRDATAPDKSAQPVGNKKGDHQLEELASTEMEESNLIRVARHRRSVYTMFVSYGERHNKAGGCCHCSGKLSQTL